MSALRPTPHLVERAVEAMRGLEGLRAPPQSPRLEPLRPAPAATPQPSSDHQAGLGTPPRLKRIAAGSAPVDGQNAPPSTPERVSPVSPHADEAPAATPPRPKVDLAALRRAGLAALPGRARSRVSEEVTVVQHQVLRTLRAAQAAEEGQSRDDRIVLVTSARPGEGKTWCALNIAAGLASSGAVPVVLVDADGKPGCLSDLLGLAGEPGLRTLAADPCLPPERALADAEVPRLTVLPFGTQPRPEATTTASVAALAAAVQRLAAALPEHVVVVDAQPCLASSDPATFASVAGQVLMVVEAERTSRSEVEAALDMVDACQTLQLVLNKVRLTGNDTFGAYHA
jgi:receptor protein-tyrosine kinase